MDSPPPSPRPPSAHSPTSPPPPPPPFRTDEPPLSSDAGRRYPRRSTRAVPVTPNPRGRSLALAPTPSPLPQEASGFSARYPVRSRRAARPPARTLALGSSSEAPPPSEAPPAPQRSEVPVPPPSAPPPPSEARTTPPPDLRCTADIEQDAQVIKIPLVELQTVLDTLGVPGAERSAIINNVSKKCLAVYNRALDYEKKRCSTMVKSISLLEAQCNELCSVLGEKFALSDEKKLSASLPEIHGLLTTTLLRFKELKEERLQILQALQVKIIDLWDHLEVTLEDQKVYYYMIRNNTATLDEVTTKDALSAALLSETRSEVKRLESQLIQEIKKKFAVLASNLRQTHLSCHEDYELKFSLVDVHEGRIDMFSADAKLHELIVKSKKDILQRAEIIDQAEVILNKRKGSGTYNEEGVTSLVKRVQDWELEHDRKFVYDERDLIKRLIEPETEYHHSTDEITPLTDENQSPMLSEGSDDSDDSESDDDSDFEPSESEE